MQMASLASDYERQTSDSYRFPSLPLPEQRAIAQALRNLDDKIEVNRRMCETLDEMARALFRSWFVDFDPVRAKMERRWSPGESLPGLPAHWYNLFPDRLVDSQLGPIPEGWKVGRLQEVAEERRRGTRPTEIDPNTPYIALAHMPRQSIALAEWTTADGVASRKLAFEQGEILFGKLRPYFHKVGVAPVRGVCSTDIVVIQPRSSDWFGFVLGHMASTEFVDYTDAGSTGTRMPRTSWKMMVQYELAIPPKALAHTFTEYIRPLINRIITGIHTSRSLADLRAILLPRLVSGELDGRRVQLP